MKLEDKLRSCEKIKNQKLSAFKNLQTNQILQNNYSIDEVTFWNKLHCTTSELLEESLMPNLSYTRNAFWNTRTQKRERENIKPGNLTAKNSIQLTNIKYDNPYWSRTLLFRSKTCIRSKSNNNGVKIYRDGQRSDLSIWDWIRIL